MQIRRPTKGVNLDEYFSTKRAAERFLRQVEHAIDDGQPITQNVRSSETFEDAVKFYVEDPAAYTTPRRRQLKESARKDRRNRTLWLSKHCLGPILLKNLTWALVDEKLTQKAKERSWSAASRYRYETTLSRFLEYAKRKGWVAYNVMADSERFNDADQRR
ncbi:MAG: hypothetical protein O7F71_03805, partial [Gammaproteobacteria bacterium]|nr:hypothetical protein [Gammaproteobacteria bacterium]